MKKINVLFLTLLVTVSSCISIFSMVPIVRTTKLENIENKITAFYTTRYNHHTILGDIKGNIYLHDDAKLNPCEKVFKGTGGVVKIVGSQDDRVIVVSFRALYMNNNEEIDFLTVLMWDSVERTYKVSHRLMASEAVIIYNIAITPDNKALFFIGMFVHSSRFYVNFVDLVNMPRDEDNIVDFGEDAINSCCRYEIEGANNNIFFPTDKSDNFASNKKMRFFLHGSKIEAYDLSEQYVDGSEKMGKVIKKIGNVSIPQLDKIRKPTGTILSEDSKNNLVLHVSYVQPSVSITYETYKYNSEEKKFMWLSTKKFNAMIDLHNLNNKFCFLEKNIPNYLGFYLLSGFNLLDNRCLDSCVELDFSKGIRESIVCKTRCNDTLSVLIKENYNTYTILRICFVPRKLLPCARPLRSRFDIYKLNKKFVLKKDCDNDIVIVSEKKHAKDMEKEGAEARAFLESVGQASEEEQESIDLDDLAYSSSDEEGSDFGQWENEMSD